MAKDTYIVICEGASECNYLRHLNQFLKSLPFPDGWFRPLNFIDRPKRINPLTLKNEGVGGGRFSKVQKAYKTEFRSNKCYPFLLWVDDDIYVRNDEGCLDSYNAKACGIPDFAFSIHNFEDFLALHLDDDGFEVWKTEFASTSHFSTPLHSEEYLLHFEKVMPGYKKNELPDGFVCETSLKNMMRHLSQLPPMGNGELRHMRVFAGELSQILQSTYSGIFR
jgi:hypothetical protein